MSLTLGWTGTLADARIASASIWNAKQSAISLTTTGSSGAATFLSNVLNIPTYTLSGLGAGTWASLNYPTWISGTPFVKMTAAGTFALDTNTYYLASNPSGYTSNIGTVTSIATSGPITGGTITGSGTIGITQSTTSTDGYLSNTDWNTFNGKQATLVSGTNIKTINSTSLLGSGNITVGTFTLPSLTSGSVLFSDGTTIAQNNANFFWDNTNSRLGIGTNTPSVPLDVVGIGKLTANSAGYTPVLQIENTGSGSVANKNVALFIGARGNSSNIDDNTNIGLWQKNNTVNNYGVFNFYNSAGALSAFFGCQYAVQTGTATGHLILGTTNTGTVSEKMRIASTGNVLIGTTTDAGYKLDVNGNTIVRGQVLTTTGFYTSGTGSALNFYGGTTGTSSSYIFNIYGSTNSTTSNTFVNISRTYDPVGGTGIYNTLLVGPTINQTGGANGITRGLYINPTLTSAADFRAIEVASGITILGASTTAKASLRIPSGTAPTSPVNGDIWFDGTNIKMQIGGVTKTFTLV